MWTSSMNHCQTYEFNNLNTQASNDKQNRKSKQRLCNNIYNDVSPFLYNNLFH